MGDMDSHVATSCSQGQASSVGTRVHSVEMLGEGSNGKFQTTQAIAKTKRCSLQIDSRGGMRGGSLPRTIPTECIEHGEVNLVPAWSPYSYVLDSLVGKGTQPQNL